MTATVLPEHDAPSERAPTLLDAHSVLWRYAGDVRFQLFLARAFVLQVMHPTAAAGVGEHSTFKSDPWGRTSSVLRVLETIYEPDGARVGAAVWEAHKGIKGRKPDGTHYHAFEPEPYFWVVATGMETLVDFARRVGHPFSSTEERGLYEETRELGRRFGVRDRDMPADLDAFHDWYTMILDERLEDTPTARDLLDLLAHVPPPPHVPKPLWGPLGTLGSHELTVITIGTLPPQIRERLDIGWNRAQEAELQAVMIGLRALGALPTRLRYMPVARAAFNRARLAA